MAHTFFALHVDPGSQLGQALALMLSVALAGLIGLEREVHGHPAGLRTHILVSVGATVATLVSAHLAVAMHVPGDPARLAAQIVSGIGFLGAGAIVHEGISVRGLTTAASIWTTAMIGIAVGAGPQFGELAVIATAVVVFTLWSLQWVDRFIDSRGAAQTVLVLHASNPAVAVAAAVARGAERHLEVDSIQMEAGPRPGLQRLLVGVRAHAGADRAGLLGDMASTPGVSHASFDTRHG